MSVTLLLFLLDPIYDSLGSYQATGGSLNSSSIKRWVDTSSHSIQHYAFLTGSNGNGAIGIAYVGTACFRNSNGTLQSQLGFFANYSIYIVNDQRFIH